MRYLLLFGWGLLWFVPAFRHTHGVLNDWQPFEVGARTLVHWHHMKVWSTPALHLYVGDPQLQIGPPPLLLIAPFERFRPYTVAVGFGVAMVVAGVVVTAVLTGGHRRRSWSAARPGIWLSAFAAQLAVVALWSHEVGVWRHLDDVMALVGIGVGLRLCRNPARWWLVGAVVGTAIAAKPWAVVAVPFLLGLPRGPREKAFLLTVAAAGLWWIPFVLAAPGTIGALGDYHVYPEHGSVLFLLDLHANVAGWLRPTQFIIGAGAAYVVARRGNWLAAPFAGIAARVLTDPYAFSYYSMGPLLLAFGCDVDARRNFPRWTASVVTVEYIVPEFASPRLAAAAKLVWAVVVIVLLACGRSSACGSTQESPLHRADRLTISPIRPLKLLRSMAETSAVIEPHGWRRGTTVARRRRKARGLQGPGVRPAASAGTSGGGPCAGTHHQARLT